MKKTGFILIFFVLYAAVLLARIETIEIDWGDGTSPMTMSGSETYLEMNVRTDAGEQKIYYHDSWIVGGKLLHWLDSEKKPQHKYLKSGSYNIRVLKKDQGGSVVEETTGKMTINDTPSESELRAKEDGVMEPVVYAPVITDPSGGHLLIPGAEVIFTPNYSFIDAGITDHTFYTIKKIEWKFMPPWKPEGIRKRGFSVIQDCFSVPSSCMNADLVRQYDKYQNKVTYDVFFSFSGTTPQSNTLLTGKGPSIQANTYVDYFASPDCEFVLPVMDVVPMDEDISKLPADYCIVSVPRELNPPPVTGGMIPADICVQIKDENPNLVPETLSCLIDFVPGTLSPNLDGNRIGTIIFSAPTEFQRFPSDPATADGPEDFYSISRWKTSSDLPSRLPINFKGILKFWVQIKGFGPAEPYFPVGHITVIDNDAPNLFIRFNDYFDSKLRNELYISDRTLDETGSIPLEMPSTDGKLFQYDYINDKQTWENEVPEKKLFEDTRIFVTIYAIENINNVSGTPMIPYKHLKSLHYKVIEQKTKSKIAENTIDQFDSEKIDIPPLLFPQPGKYDFMITVFDRAEEDQQGNTVFTGISNNRRDLNVVLNITNINQKSDSIRGR